MLLFTQTDAPLSLKNIDPILAEVLDWHTLGIKLDLPVQLLQEIKVNYSAFGTGRQKQEMITTWLEYDTEASWDKLADALKEMGKHVAAAKIWNTYVTGYRGKSALVSKMSIYRHSICSACGPSSATIAQNVLSINSLFYARKKTVMCNIDFI